jgi:ABC-type glycerol-3-phosphate transport system permease component
MSARPFDYRRLVGRVLGITGVAVILVIVLFPLYWMLLASLRPVGETLHDPPIWLPDELTLAAYQKLLTDPTQIGYFLNTYIIAISTAVFSIALSALCAYGFSRFRIRGAKYILLGVLALQLLPNVALLLPFFNLSQALGIHNTYLALIIANSAFAMPIAIWLLKGFFDSIPFAIEEAALLDGCSRLQCFRYVVLPIALPGLIGTGVFCFLWAWNEFLFAVVLTAGPDVAPLTVRMSQFFSQYGRDWNSIMALNVIALLPLLAIFIWLQRWVVSGMTAGAVK